MTVVHGEWAYHRGSFVRAAEPHLPLTTQALHYGTGVYEGIRANRAASGDRLQLFRVHDHYDRFLRSARALRIDVGASAEDLTKITVDLLRRNEFTSDVYVRPLAYKLGLLPGTPPGVGLAGVSDAVSIVPSAMGPYRPLGGLRCAISSWRRPRPDAVPVQAKVTGGYLNSALAVDEARAAGYDDAILLNDRGHVAEAGTSNVVAVLGGLVVTPPASAGILAGITRDTVLALAAELGIDSVERDLALADLLTADEVFLTGTGIGVAPVVEIAGRGIGVGVPGPVTTRLAEHYERAVRGEDADWRGWLTAVDFE